MAPERTDTLAVTWVGHSTVLIELDGIRIITDPALHRRVGPLRRVASPVQEEARRDIDAILVSHLHADHTDLPSLRAIGVATPILAPRGAGSWLSQHGFTDVRELRAGEQASVGAARVSATPASHGSSRRPLGSLRAEPIGFVIGGSQAVYFAGDTDLFDAMSELAGTIDLALLPVWGWGPTLGPGHLNPERAVTAAARIAPRVAVPIHWGTLALPRPARDPRDAQRPAREFAERMAVEAPAIETRVLRPGERTELAPRKA